MGSDSTTIIYVHFYCCLAVKASKTEGIVVSYLVHQYCCCYFFQKEKMTKERSTLLIFSSSSVVIGRDDTFSRESSYFYGEKLAQTSRAENSNRHCD